MDHKSKKSWFGAVFGSIFLVCGLAAAYGSAGNMIFGYIASSGWVEVPATIHKVKLVTKYGDSTTYTVKSTYSYEFDGAEYQGDVVSLSSGSDNFGTYWQELERTLLANQRSNEASVFVNPINPSKSVLDRTLRWKSIVFGSVFLILFSGFGGFFIWTSLSGAKTRQVRLQNEQELGINSSQKTGSWMLAAFGGVFFLIGTGVSLVALPQAIRDGDYGVLFVLVFVLIGAGTIYHAFKLNRAYRRFGPTPLFLDPSVPGLGGQLGGEFSVNVPDICNNADSAAPLQVRLTCTRKTKSGKNTRYNIEWQEESHVYLKQTANGVDASFLFEIPNNCIATKEWSRGSAIEWTLTVEGEFSTSALGKFEREWQVVVEERAAQASSILSIPQSFILKSKKRTEDRVSTSALEQVPVTEDIQYINVHSKAGRGFGGKLVGILLGAIFAGVGVFTIMQSWWPGYIFIFIGGTIALGSLHFLGKSIVVTIDKNSRVLRTQESWFGLVYARRQGVLADAGQFSIKQTSSSSTHNKVTEYYALDFKSNGKRIRIAGGIKGKQEALALKDAIAGRCFVREQWAAVA